MPRSYSNNAEIVAKLRQLRSCISRKHYGLYLKISGGVKCDTVELVKLSLIAYLLDQYQSNDEDCLTQASEKESWSILNRFLAYTIAECRDCMTTYTSNVPVTSSSPVPITYNFATQSGDEIVTQTGDTIQKL